MPPISPCSAATKARFHPMTIGNGMNAAKTAQSPLISPSVSRDTFHPQFGTSPATGPEQPGWFKREVWSRMKASAKGAMQGTFTYKNWKWDLGYVGIGFLATLPFAAAIPGSHIILLPALYVGGRLLNGLARGAQGLYKPSLIESGTAAY
jgi:hypothetical protein